MIDHNFYIEQAIQNAKTLRWLAIQKSDLLHLIRENYAAFLRCPFDETCEDFTSDEDLAFIYNNFKIDIEELNRTNA